MEWRGRRQSDNVEDRQGEVGGLGGSSFGRSGGFSLPVGRRGGGISIGTIIFLVVICLVLKVMGIDLMQVMDGGTGSYEQSEQQGGETSQIASPNEMTSFVKTIVAVTEDTWQGIFQAQGRSYEDPTLVLFRGQTRSGCVAASEASGPFYCPENHKVYLDTSIFDELSNRFGASGDFAKAYVVAHEVGHHIHNPLGILPKFNEATSEVDATKMSVRVELQVDCFAGILGRYTQQNGILDAGDLEEALNAAKQIGDDTLQKQTQGYVIPDSFNHGTSTQRMKRFKQGFDTGRLSACDTFSGPV